MQKQMNGTLFDEGFIEYSQDQDQSKQSARPVGNHIHVISEMIQPNPSKYHNPPDKYEQTQDTTRYGQNSVLHQQNEQARKAKLQRAQILRERAGLLKSEPPRKQENERKKWGNFLVIYDKNFSITLGPDYWCFIPTFICFTAVSIAVLSLVFSNSQNVIVKLFGVLICGGELISYLMMAISNPGIAFQEEDDDEIQLENYSNPDTKEPSKLCKKCGFYVARSSYHCRDCDLCILGYDHHCPWTSKCIGKNNLCRFYTFLAFTPIFLVYIAVAFVVTMSQTASMSRVHHLTNS